MRTITTLIIVLLPLVGQANLLYSEDFESATSTWALNTSDLGGSSTTNSWVINNAYVGGSGTLICLGFPFTFTVVNTPMQPASITGSPTSRYLHTLSTAAQSASINNSSYRPADGLCQFSESIFARMTTEIDTTNATGVSFDFWWLGVGSANNFMEIYYSTNSGTSWTQVTVPTASYFNQPTWIEASISLPAFEGQNTLRFGVRFVNNTTSSTNPVGFAIDDIRINAMTVPVELMDFTID